ncbi:MAG: D-alanyl-D-alanine carboxypeptidase family protein [Oscillospiraceae bacterium]|nr:D-alanyl-D-alanine carboxypeptidase family protein [Oscillospiraceae bacterium]
MATQKQKKKQKNNIVLPAAILTTFGLAAILTVLVADHTPRSNISENSADVIEELPEITTEVTVTTAETSETTAEVTTEPAPLPPGSVTGLTLSFYETALKVGDTPVMPLVTMTPEDAVDKSEKWETTDPAVATVDGIGWITAVGAGSCIVRVTSVNNPAVFAEVKVSVADPNGSAQAKRKPAETKPADTAPAETTANAAAAGTVAGMEVKDGITYIQGVMIVNKTYSLPASYNPQGLLPEAQAAFAEMQAGAKADGYTLTSASDFRSYETQETLYNNYVARDGKEKADTFSARAGHSEHQTGLTIDVNYAGDEFNSTPEAKWLADNCWKYGFIIRYPQGKEAATGFKYESWHIRYVGKELAQKITESGLCLEEYFGIDSKYAE